MHTGMVGCVLEVKWHCTCGKFGAWTSSALVNQGRKKVCWLKFILCLVGQFSLSTSRRFLKFPSVHPLYVVNHSVSKELPAWCSMLALPKQTCFHTWKPFVFCIINFFSIPVRAMRETGRTVHRQTLRDDINALFFHDFLAETIFYGQIPHQNTAITSWLVIDQSLEIKQ